MDAGFRVGMEVVRKKDETLAVITDITPAEVTLKLADGSLMQSSSEPFIEGAWKKHVPRAAAVQLSDWQQHAPGKSKEFLAAVLKSKILVAMEEQLRKHQHDADLDIMLKPKDVISKRSFAQKQLSLPCATTRVDIKHGSFEAAGGSVYLGKASLLKGEDVAVVLNPATTLPKEDGASAFVNPFWLVPTTHRREDANMELVGLKATVQVGNIQLPVLRNFRKISEGDSLLLFKLKDVEESTEPASKKARK